LNDPVNSILAKYVIMTDKKEENKEEDCLELISKAAELQKKAKDIKNKTLKKQLETEIQELEKKAEEIFNDE